MRSIVVPFAPSTPHAAISPTEASLVTCTRSLTNRWLWTHHHSRVGITRAAVTSPVRRHLIQSGRCGVDRKVKSCSLPIAVTSAQRYPADIGVQDISDCYWRKSTDEECRNQCIITPKCSHYKFSSAGNWCYIMPIVKPVVYYSTTGSCGYVVKRN